MNKFKLTPYEYELADALAYKLMYTFNREALLKIDEDTKELFTNELTNFGELDMHMEVIHEAWRFAVYQSCYDGSFFGVDKFDDDHLFKMIDALTAGVEAQLNNLFAEDEGNNELTNQEAIEYAYSVGLNDAGVLDVLGMKTPGMTDMEFSDLVDSYINR